VSDHDRDDMRQWFSIWRSLRRKHSPEQVAAAQAQDRLMSAGDWQQHLAHAQPCPQCGAAPHALTWSYARFSQPGTSLGGFGGEGWFGVRDNCELSPNAPPVGWIA
jgi:hypothetical protein